MKRNNLQGQVVRLETEKLHLENEIERLNYIINELENQKDKVIYTVVFELKLDKQDTWKVQELSLDDQRKLLGIN